MKPIAVEVAYDAIRIKLDGILHLHIMRSRLIGVQSWISDSTGRYCIEYTMQGGNVLSEYDTIEKFKFILNRLEKIL